MKLNGSLIGVLWDWKGNKSNKGKTGILWDFLNFLFHCNGKQRETMRNNGKESQRVGKMKKGKRWEEMENQWKQMKIRKI